VGPTGRSQGPQGGRRGLIHLSSGERMSDHKFKIGQAVSSLGREMASGTYKVVQLLPSEGDDFQYRIRNPNEPHERVAKERDLERISSP
jgi:hypothetical protein